MKMIEMKKIMNNEMITKMKLTNMTQQTQNMRMIQNEEHDDNYETDEQ